MHDYHQQLVSRALMQTWIPQTNHFAVQFDLQALFAKFAKVEVNQVDLNHLPPLNLLVPVESVKYGHGVLSAAIKLGSLEKTVRASLIVLWCVLSSPFL